MKPTFERIEVCGARVLLLLCLAISSACTDETSGAPAEPAANGPVVSRAVQEPPGAHCPEGGTAVQSGIDRNGDSMLGDGEVDNTLYVCQRDRVRLVAEPAGAHCAQGGTAIWVGDDTNGDDVLESNEARGVSYLCDTVHALLTRLVSDPPGAPCAGGAAIQVGHDLDDDGVLDDTEVMITEYACGAALADKMVIKDAADVAFFQGVRAVAGELRIEYALVDEVELPNLYFVGGGVNVDFNHNLTSLRLPALYRVADAFYVWGNDRLTEVAMPELRYVDGNLSFFRNAALPALELDGIEVRGQLTIAGNGRLAGIDWADITIRGGIQLYGNSALTTAKLESTWMFEGGIDVHENPQLAVLDIQAAGASRDVAILTNYALTALRLRLPAIRGDLSISNPMLATLDAGTETVVYGDLSITGSPISAMTFGVGPASGLYVFGDAFLSGLEVTQLDMDQCGIKQVYGRLTIQGNRRLSTVLMHAPHDLEISMNPMLQTAAFSWYETISHANSLRIISNPMLRSFQAQTALSIDEVEIVDNPLLTSPGLSLSSAYSISIIDNASMPVCQIQALFDAVAAYSEVQSGNDEDGVCH